MWILWLFIIDRYGDLKCDNIFVNRTKKVVKNSKSIWWFVFVGWSMVAKCVGVELLFFFFLDVSMLYLILNSFRWVFVSFWICWTSCSIVFCFIYVFLFCFVSFNLIKILILIQLKKKTFDYQKLIFGFKIFFFLGWWFLAIVEFVERYYRVSL